VSGKPARECSPSAVNRSEGLRPCLVLAHATYDLQDAAGNTFHFESTAMGFRIDGHQVLLPKSVLEPWKFDPYVAPA